MKILHFHRDSPHPSGAVYIGRPSIWGNPFVIGRDGDRAEVLSKYRSWICQQPKLLERLDELRGKDLICWCAPHPCHGEYLIELMRLADESNRLSKR